jgi:hypothetical protein
LARIVTAEPKSANGYESSSPPVELPVDPSLLDESLSWLSAWVFGGCVAAAGSAGSLADATASGFGALSFFDVDVVCVASSMPVTSSVSVNAASADQPQPADLPR